MQNLFFFKRQNLLKNLIPIQANWYQIPVFEITKQSTVYKWNT